ncbi:hypothetical protein B0T14DRAFT_518399 [Immersiella caudata]|uniref:Uncharacterized protein n=1 Tax=Immersiella caudata TaxID=314043 RepID=A0AA39WP49_9PEZI|nr:hypothetical protein B0T14DRAFT_518399 [Immersiella caudata]
MATLPNIYRCPTAQHGQKSYSRDGVTRRGSNTSAPSHTTPPRAPHVQRAVEMRPHPPLPSTPSAARLSASRPGLRTDGGDRV